MRYETRFNTTVGKIKPHHAINNALIAATDGEIGKILISNKAEELMELALTLEGGWTVVKYRVLQGTDGLVEADLSAGETLVVPASKLVMLECVKA